MPGYLALIVKATRLCNLRCSYCHDWRSERDQRMGFEVLARMTQAALTGGRYRSIEFIWHGGEPLILPMSFYEKALYVQARFRCDGQIVTNSLQTNATLMTDEWARFLRWHGFKVSISLDGPPEIHDRYRVSKSGRGSSAEVARGMALLREHEIPFSALMVVDEAVLALGGARVFDYFVENDIRHFALLAVTPHNLPHAPRGTPIFPYVEPARMTAFLADVFDRWVAHGDPDVHIREIDALRHRIAGYPPGLCTLAGGCLGKYFAVEPNGDVAHCDLYVGDPRYSLGNVLEHDFSEFAESPELASLRRENEDALDRLRVCPEFGVCNGWCPHERYLSTRHAPEHDDGCCGLRELIVHMRAQLGSAGTPMAFQEAPA